MNSKHGVIRRNWFMGLPYGLLRSPNDQLKKGLGKRSERRTGFQLRSTRSKRSKGHHGCLLFKASMTLQFFIQGTNKWGTRSSWCLSF